jgi:DNA-binding NarL/FixJ family response regulator
MPEPITVMIVDDHEMVRKGAKGYLEAQPEIVVVAEAGRRQCAWPAKIFRMSS